MKAIILVRVSTEKQNLEQQEQELFALALKNGYSEENIILNSVKESGINLSEEERNGLNAMKNAIEKDSSINCVFCWEISRIARTKKVLFSILEYLVSKKIQLVIKEPSIKLLNDDESVNEGSETIFTLFAQLAESEMRNKKARFKRTKVANSLKGKYNGGYVKFGYFVDEDGIYQINEKEADLIRLVFNLYSNGLSEIGVTRELIERGYEKVTVNKVRNILISEQYTGFSDRYGQERIYPQIIDNESFNLCREVAKHNNVKADKAKNIYYAKNLIKCTCGGHWMGILTNLTYFCNKVYMDRERIANKNAKLKCENRQSININTLDSLLWHICRIREAEYWQTEAKNDMLKFNEQINILKTKIKASDKIIESNNNKISNVVDSFIDNLISKEKRDSKISSIRKEIAEINNNVTKWTNEIKRYNELISEINKRIYDGVDEEIQMMKLIDEVNNITDDKQRFDIIHRHIKEIHINKDSFEGKEAKRIDIAFMNDTIKTYYYLYKSKISKICFYFEGQACDLKIENLHRFEEQEKIKREKRKLKHNKKKNK